jgi:hypothetical protein
VLVLTIAAGWKLLWGALAFAVLVGVGWWKLGS